MNINKNKNMSKDNDDIRQAIPVICSNHAMQKIPDQAYGLAYHGQLDPFRLNPYGLVQIGLDKFGFPTPCTLPVPTLESKGHYGEYASGSYDAYRGAVQSGALMGNYGTMRWPQNSNVSYCSL
jgi:hypothetical protein